MEKPDYFCNKVSNEITGKARFSFTTLVGEKTVFVFKTFSRYLGEAYPIYIKLKYNGDSFNIISIDNYTSDIEYSIRVKVDDEIRYDAINYLQEHRNLFISYSSWLSDLIWMHITIDQLEYSPRELGYKLVTDLSIRDREKITKYMEPDYLQYINSKELVINPTGYEFKIQTKGDYIIIPRRQHVVSEAGHRGYIDRNWKAYNNTLTSVNMRIINTDKKQRESHIPVFIYKRVRKKLEIKSVSLTTL